eukprot:618608-Prorocentrum_minimum.AAC.5
MLFSFRRVDSEGLIEYARDIVEPPTKPGDAGMGIMGAVFPLVRSLPQPEPAQQVRKHKAGTRHLTFERREEVCTNKGGGDGVFRPNQPLFP